MHSPKLRTSKSVLRVAGVLATLGLIGFAASAGAKDEPKKAPPAPHAAAPHPAPSGGGAPHGPTAGGGGGHPTPGGPGAGHPTTNNPGGGGHPTTSNPGGGGGHPTTSNPGGGGHPTTNNPGGGAGHPTTSNPGGGAGHPTTNNPGGGGHPTTNGAGAGHPNNMNGGHPGGLNNGGRPGAMAGGHPGGGAGRPGGPAASHAFGGHPSPAGAHEMHAANGGVIRTRADGSHMDVHDARRGMDIHHGLDGNRRVVVERPDHSRVFAERGGRGYVQHPYTFHGREFGQRTYFEHGHAYARFYRRYPYHGAYLEVYAPARYYRAGFYGWAYNPWAAPVPYAWGWGGNPWYGYYGYYFTPYPVYAGAAFWLTDYLISQSLQANYAAQQAANVQMTVQASNGQAVLTPDVKQMIADEVKIDVQQETAEAQSNSQGGEQQSDNGTGGIAQLMSDNRPHVFVAGSDLDLVDASGRECLVSQGDVMRVDAAPSGDAPTVNATILASKGGKECDRSANVSVAVTDLQEMQNHMRETIDQGMSDLQAKQGKGGLPKAPSDALGAPADAAFASGAPPPDSNAASEINQQAQAADQAEQDVASSATAGSGGGGDSGAGPTTISLGQTTDQVSAELGQPTKIIDLGAKKIYTYPDMKITFMNGKVSDVQ